MRYLIILILSLFTGYLFLFSKLNSTLVSLDFYFFEFENLTLGFSLIVFMLSGSIIAFLLQTPILIRKNKKNYKKDHPEEIQS